MALVLLCLLAAHVIGCGWFAIDSNPQLAEVHERHAPEPALCVTLQGAKSQVGVYACGLFSNQEDFDSRENPVRSARLAVSDRPVSWSITTLEPGTYAIAVFHDANENGKLDRHALGYPTEAYGFSNNARGRLGPARYSAARFELGDVPMSIRVQTK